MTWLILAGLLLAFTLTLGAVLGLIIKAATPLGWRDSMQFGFALGVFTALWMSPHFLTIAMGGAK